MEIVTRCFVEQRSELTKCLLRESFTYDQVLRFLPNAALAIYESTQVTSIYETMACLLAGCSYDAKSTINVDAIAQNSSMDYFKVAIGLNAIAPVLLPSFAQKANSRFHIGPDEPAKSSQAIHQRNVA